MVTMQDNEHDWIAKIMVIGLMLIICSVIDCNDKVNDIWPWWWWPHWELRTCWSDLWCLACERTEVSAGISAKKWFDILIMLWVMMCMMLPNSSTFTNILNYWTNVCIFYLFSAYCGGLWLAALRVMAEIATILDYPEERDKYMNVLEHGKKSYIKLLWNGMEEQWKEGEKELK